jgi:hypothetical protein
VTECFCVKLIGFRAILHLSSKSPLKCITLEDEGNLTDVCHAMSRRVSLNSPTYRTPRYVLRLIPMSLFVVDMSAD